MTRETPFGFAQRRLAQRGLWAQGVLIAPTIGLMRTAEHTLLASVGLVLFAVLAAVGTGRHSFRVRRAALLIGLLFSLVFFSVASTAGIFSLAAFGSLFALYALLLLEGIGAALLAAVATAVGLAVAIEPGRFGLSPAVGLTQSHQEVALLGLAVALLALPILFVVAEIDGATRSRAEALDRIIAEEMRRDEALRLHRVTQDELRAGQRERTLGRIAGGLAHEINSVLQEIEGYIEVLGTQDGGSSESSQAVSEMRASVARAAAVGRRLLFVGGQNLSTGRPTSLASYLENVWPTLLAAAGTSVRLELALVRSSTVFVDATELTHALVNLIINSRDATRGEGEIVVRVDRIGAFGLPDDAGNLARITVTDNGPGIPARVLEHVFEPFFTTKGKNGTGLGLTTVRRLIEGAGGSVSIASEKGHGTSVLIELSARAETPSLHPPGSQRLPGDAEDGLRAEAIAERPVVLFVEDQKEIRQVFSQVLPRLGVDLRVADSVDAALAALGSIEPDLIWSDAIMPGRPTQDLIDAALSRGIPIVICSGHVQEELLRRDIRASDVEFVPKPYRAQAVVERARRVLWERSARLAPRAAATETGAASRGTEGLIEADVSSIAGNSTSSAIADAAPTGRRPQSDRPSERPLGPPRLRVLMADDDDGVRRSLKRGLERLGFDVVDAESGEGAIARFRGEGPFDVILLDANMPGLDGLSAAAHLRILDADARIAICTGWAPEPSDALKAIDEIIVKPIALGELAARLRWLGSRPPLETGRSGVPGTASSEVRLRGGARLSETA